MISRRNYLMISFIMAMVLFLFVASSIAKKKLNNYELNQYAQEQDLDYSDSEAYDSTKLWNTAVDSGKEQVVYIGDLYDDQIGNVVKQWADYTKRGLSSYQSFEQWEVDDTNLPKFVLLDSDYVNWDTDVEQLQELTDAGVDLIFCNLPDFTVIAENEQLMSLLGITFAYQENVSLSGIKLFDGFLLGGDREFIASNETEEKQQDMQLEIPWYVTKSACKVYMVGQPAGEENEKLQNEVYPSIIWRTSVNEAKVFAVNGDYLEQNDGIGILYAMTYESSDYELYPIVNAQNVSILNYPDLINENDSYLQEAYSMDSTAVFRDLVLPELIALKNRLGIHMTCFIAPKLDYSNGTQMSQQLLNYYMQTISDQEAEAAISLYLTDTTEFSKKLQLDRSFLYEMLPEYQFTSFYLGNQSLVTVKSMMQQDLFANIRTILMDYDGGTELLTFDSDMDSKDVTVQQSTNDGFSHTYSEDFRLLSIETALGYSTVSVDLSRVIYPEDGEEQFGVLSQRFASYLSTYWEPFSAFTQTTLTQSDTRVKKFLMLDYAQQRDGNTITLQTNDVVTNQGEVYFLLRTHDETIETISGADYEEVEDGTYLITVYDQEAEITLKEDQNLQFTR